MKAASQEIQHPTDPARSAFSAAQDGGDWADYPLASPEDSTDAFEALFASSTGIPSLGCVAAPPSTPRWARVAPQR